jgi:N-dimethylarginine dimethylaminohydrolase
VDEAVEDGIGVGWVTDDLVPFVDRHLAGQDGRASAITFFEDLVEIAASTAIERFEAPIVEDEELSAVEASHDAGMAPVAAGQREIGEEFGDALIQNGTVVAASLVTESTGKPTFAGAGRSSVILPGIRESKFGSSIRITHVAVKSLRLSA